VVGRINAYFVCGGKYHDIDFPRIEILRLLNEKERIRVRIAENYHDIEAITAADFLITYAVDLIPTPSEQEAISAWLATGRKWFALHGTNSILQVEGGKCKTPRTAPVFMHMLGSQFIAHPPIAQYTVEVVEPSHPLVEGLPGHFQVLDELYLAEQYEGNHVLLQTHFNGMAEAGFEEADWRTDDPRPVMYLREHGKGEVLYFTLGHRRGRYDMEPFTSDYPNVDPGAWIQPSFYELLRRGIEWSAGVGQWSKQGKATCRQPVV
jgi:type 1 glutamine amidotransferase